MGEDNPMELRYDAQLQKRPALQCTQIHHRLLRSKMLVLENNVLNCIECVGPCLT